LYERYHAQGRVVPLDTSCLEPYEEKFSATSPDYLRALDRYLLEGRSMAPWSAVAATTAAAERAGGEEGGNG